jgi:hypothetical protein
MRSGDEVVNDPCEYMAQLAQRILPLAKWGFEENFRLGKRLIYNSKLCRLKIVWGNWDYMGGNCISIYYGRLHAPSEAVTMKWNGEECACWHDIECVLHFLDGSVPESAESASKMGYSHPVKEKFLQSEVGKSLTGKRRQPEWLMQMHAAIWEHYAPHLFEVFDLRCPELWEQYREFLRACYVAEGRSEEIDEKKWMRIPYYRVY